MKKLINVVMASVLGLSVVGVSQASSPSNQGAGTVTFKGRVIDAPCGISSESTNKVVEFGDLSAAELDVKGKTVPFSIKLENCDIAYLKEKVGSKSTPKNTVNIAFSGAMTEGDPSMLGTVGGTGVGIMLSIPGSGSYIKMDGTPVAASSIMSGNGNILLEAEARRARESVGVVPGEFYATANFSLSYE